MPLHLGPSPTGGTGTPPLSDVATTATSSGALTVGRHNPVDATSGNLTMTVADAAGAGKDVAVSKRDSTANAVTVSFSHLRDTGPGSITLVGQFEALQLVSKADGSWWPIGDHKTKAYFDSTYAKLGGVAGVLDWWASGSAWPARGTAAGIRQWVGPASAGQPPGALVGDLVDLVQGV